MHDSKLLLLIKGLDQNELHWFQKFLASPFYNNNKEYIKLFQLIKKHYPDFKPSKLSKANAFEKLYPKQKFNAQKMRKLMHGLAVLVEEFLVAMQIRNNPFEKKKLLIQSLGNRNIYDRFEKEIKGSITQLEDLPYRDAAIYYKTYDLYYKYYDHIGTNKQNTNNDALKKTAFLLDCFYLSQRQQIDLAILWQRKLLGNKIKKTTLQESQSYLSKEPAFKIYTLISNAVSESWTDERYDDVKKAFTKDVDKLSPKNGLIIIKTLLNYLSSQINKGGSGYQSKMLSLYKFGLTHGLLIENNQMSEATFGNIITIGLYEKEYQWVEQFIETHNEYLSEYVREDATCLGFGLIYYHKKDFSKTIDLILNHSFSKPLFILRSKTTLLRAYFEQYLIDASYYDFLIAQTQSFEKFMRRNNYISTTKKERYLNFILFIRKITMAHNQNTLDKKLYTKIENTPSVLLKFWLLKTLKEEIL